MSEEHCPLIMLDGSQIPDVLFCCNRNARCWRCTRCPFDCQGGLLDGHLGPDSRRHWDKVKEYFRGHRQYERLLTYNPAHPDYHHYAEYARAYNEAREGYDAWLTRFDAADPRQPLAIANRSVTMNDLQQQIAVLQNSVNAMEGMLHAIAVAVGVNPAQQGHGGQGIPFRNPPPPAPRT